MAHLANFISVKGYLASPYIFLLVGLIINYLLDKAHLKE